MALFKFKNYASGHLLTAAGTNLTTLTPHHKVCTLSEGTPNIAATQRQWFVEELSSGPTFDGSDPYHYSCK